jgi:hypothetical protein
MAEENIKSDLTEPLEDFNYSSGSTIGEFVILMEKRLTKTLSGQIKDLVKPLNESKIEYLEDELKVATFIIEELQNTVLGFLALKQINRRMRKADEKKRKEREKSIADREHVTTLIGENDVEEDRET